ncbi:MAG: DUF1028 domain-containing protein [Pseudomonadota bacterium]
MTFSLIARCPDTGAFGAAITTSNLAVGSRCVRLLHRGGAFLSQHRTDPRLGNLGIELLGRGDDAGTAIRQVSASTPEIEWRQLAAMDRSGGMAVYHGRQMYSIHTHSKRENCLAIGNILANETVTECMAEAFDKSQAQALPDRLMLALEAGRDAGGEIIGPLRSSSLRVTGAMGIDDCDLRIDKAQADAVGELRALFETYRTEAALLRKLATEPDTIAVSRRLFEASLTRIRERGLDDRFPAEERRSSWQVAD